MYARCISIPIAMVKPHGRQCFAWKMCVNDHVFTTCYMEMPFCILPWFLTFYLGIGFIAQSMRKSIILKAMGPTRNRYQLIYVVRKTNHQSMAAKKVF